MKTKKSLPAIKIIAISIFAILFHSEVCAQKYKPKTPCFIGGGFENFSSGNWHGAFYSPYVNLTKGRKSFSGGPVFQKRSMEFSGGKLSFSYNLSGSKKQMIDYDEEEVPLTEDYVKTNDRQLLQLNFFSFAQYVNETTLSYAAQKTEEKTEHNPVSESRRDWSKVRLSTAEAGVGFELYIKISKRISWKSYVAGSVYYHVNYISGMYHERMAPSLVLGTGIHICPL
jgi:hypothetical protein